jgi:hypothetical protein
VTRPDGRPLALALLLLGVAAPAGAQMRRDPAVPNASAARAGEFLLGAGLGWDGDRSFPLSGLRGDLLRVGTLTVAYAVADGVLLEVRGDAWHVLRIHGRGPSHVPLAPGVADGTTTDAGDFRIATVARLVGGATGPSAGVDVAVKLPNSQQSRGIGLNTTDFEGSAFGSWGGERVRVTGEVGIGILTAPLRTFIQDDVLLYGAELLWDPDGAGGLPRLAIGVRGRANTRHVVPVGLEDEGTASVGLDWERGGWLVDGSVLAGYTADSPDFGVRVGIARILRL